MWRKLMGKKNNPEQSKSIQMLLEARVRGDKRSEIALSIVVIGEEVTRLRESLARIDELYSERLEELLYDASAFFPTDVAVNLQEIEGDVYEVTERTDFLHSRIMGLMKSMTAVVRK